MAALSGPPIETLHHAHDVKVDELASSEQPRPTTASWSLDSILLMSPNFVSVERVSAFLDSNELTKKIQHYERTGIPLIIDSWHTKPHWDAKLLSPRWLSEKFPQGEY